MEGEAEMGAVGMELLCVPQRKGYGVRLKTHFWKENT